CGDPVRGRCRRPRSTALTDHESGSDAARVGAAGDELDARADRAGVHALGVAGGGRQQREGGGGAEHRSVYALSEIESVWDGRQLMSHQVQAVSGRRVAPDPRSLRLSVVIPVYNEARTVAALIERVREVDLDIEIVCVDDASTDGSRDVLERLKAQGRIDRLVFQDRNRGKGAAVRRGIQEA